MRFLIVIYLLLFACKQFPVAFVIIELFTDIILARAAPEYARSDNGSEFTAKQICEWLKDAGFIAAYVEPGSPLEKGYIESFKARM